MCAKFRENQRKTAGVAIWKKFDTQTDRQTDSQYLYYKLHWLQAAVKLKRHTGCIILDVCSDHPRCHIKPNFSMWDDTPDAVTVFSFWQNRSRGFRALKSKINFSLFKAYTTAHYHCMSRVVFLSLRHKSKESTSTLYNFTFFRALSRPDNTVLHTVHDHFGEEDSSKCCSELGIDALYAKHVSIKRLQSSIFDNF